MKAELESKPTLHLRLIRAPDDLPLVNREYQKELADFAKSLRAAGIESSSGAFAFDTVDGGGGLSGEFILMATAIAPFVTCGAGVLGAWLHARYGRKVRLKIGEIEAEAQTVAEVERLLKHAEEFQQHNKPKVILEP
jgi:hypothetical protein